MFPAQPTGTVHTAAELTEVMTLANEAGVQVISDEIHARLVEADTDFVPLIAVPGGEHALTATSAGKAWNLAGFKAGLILAGTSATPRLADIAPLALEAGGHLASLAHTAALQHAQAWLDELNTELRRTSACWPASWNASSPAQLSALCSDLPRLAGLHGAESAGSRTTLPTPRQSRLLGGGAFRTQPQQLGTHQSGVLPDLVVEAVSRMAVSL